jgi:hypothetical protein
LAQHKRGITPAKFLALRCNNLLLSNGMNCKMGEKKRKEKKRKEKKKSCLEVLG